MSCPDFLYFCPMHLKKIALLNFKNISQEELALCPGINCLVGDNGAGKTTLARCLCGLMKEQAGTILWDESPLGRKERRRKAFLIMQDVNLQLFGDSVLAEIRLGNTATEQEALTTLGRMDLAQYADTHPMALSGGQKQRLCIARALLKKPKILILDDSTSAVDTRTDTMIRAGFREYIPKTTKIIIAQRIASVQDADMIIVMDNGRIADMGTHEELMAHSAIYRETYEQQTSGGEDDE